MLFHELLYHLVIVTLPTPQFLTYVALPTQSLLSRF